MGPGPEGHEALICKQIGGVRIRRPIDLLPAEKRPEPAIGIIEFSRIIWPYLPFCGNYAEGADAGTVWGSVRFLLYSLVMEFPPSAIIALPVMKEA